MNLLHQILKSEIVSETNENSETENNKAETTSQFERTEMPFQDI